MKSKDLTVLLAGGTAMFLLLLFRVFMGGFALHVLVDVVQESYHLEFAPASYWRHVGMFALVSAMVSFLQDIKRD